MSQGHLNSFGFVWPKGLGRRGPVNPEQGTPNKCNEKRKNGPQRRLSATQDGATECRRRANKKCSRPEPLRGQKEPLDATFERFKILVRQKNVTI